MMHPDPSLRFLPALFAAVMLAGASPVGASAAMTMALCGGGSANVPGKAPSRDCDQPCHVGCNRRKAGACS